MFNLILIRLLEIRTLLSPVGFWLHAAVGFHLRMILKEYFTSVFRSGQCLYSCRSSFLLWLRSTSAAPLTKVTASLLMLGSGSLLMLDFCWWTYQMYVEVSFRVRHCKCPTVFKHVYCNKNVPVSLFLVVLALEMTGQRLEARNSLKQINIQLFTWTETFQRASSSTLLLLLEKQILHPALSSLVLALFRQALQLLDEERRRAQPVGQEQREGQVLEDRRGPTLGLRHLLNRRSLVRLTWSACDKQPLVELQ